MRNSSNGEKNTFLVKKQAEENLKPLFPSALESAMKLVSHDDIERFMDSINSKELDSSEIAIRNMSEYSNKFWLISSLVLYRTLYTDESYKKSGLEWHSYMKESKKRLGLNKVDISLQLSAARFFIKYHKELLAKNFSVTGCFSKMAKAELALELSKDLDLTINHLMNDTMAEFQSWYQSYRIEKKVALTGRSLTSTSVRLSGNDIMIDGKKMVAIADDCKYKSEIRDSIKSIIEYLNEGKFPVIVPMKSKEEADMLITSLSKAK